MESDAPGKAVEGGVGLCQFQSGLGKVERMDLGIRQLVRQGDGDATAARGEIKNPGIWNGLGQGDGVFDETLGFRARDQGVGRYAEFVPQKVAGTRQMLERDALGPSLKQHVELVGMRFGEDPLAIEEKWESLSAEDVREEKFGVQARGIHPVLG